MIQKLGAIVKQSGNDLLISSKGVHSCFFAEVNCGESGLGLRMFAPIAALSSRKLF
ncbi:MAG: hypothetical protein WKF59_12630 [Chitinophagaceae bacterium]